jgi:hypothetical protein
LEESRMGNAAKTIRPIERDTIIRALSAGVVPSAGLLHIQVGRQEEITTLLRDINHVADAGATVRFVIGERGSGTTFFKSIVRLIALERNCVTMHADLSNNRRIYAIDGKARNLHLEAVNNMATRDKPGGRALESVLESFMTKTAKAGAEEGIPMERVIDEMFVPISHFGHDFTTVLKAYWQGKEYSNERLKYCALRWLSGEYSTVTEAKKDLGVSTAIDDENIYESFKSLARLVRIAGYSGLLVMFDEMTSINKLQNSRTRRKTHEQLLHILNDALHGTMSGIGFVMCGAPEFLFDNRRGLFSFEALKSRLKENYSEAGTQINSLVLRLQNLTPAESLVLLKNIRMVFADGDPGKFLVPDEALPAFMNYCDLKIGWSHFRTVRSTVKAFVDLLSLKEQHPGVNWEILLERMPFVHGAPRGATEIN